MLYENNKKKFYLVNPDKDEQEFEITNILWGNSGFFSMEVVNVLADYNKLCIWVTIPEGVWQAWRDYSDKYYTEVGDDMELIIEVIAYALIWVACDGLKRK